jgi:hypothetical protein
VYVFEASLFLFLIRFTLDILRIIRHTFGWNFVVWFSSKYQQLLDKTGIILGQQAMKANSFRIFSVLLRFAMGSNSVRHLWMFFYWIIKNTQRDLFILTIAWKIIYFQFVQNLKL